MSKWSGIKLLSVKLTILVLSCLVAPSVSFAQENNQNQLQLDYQLSMNKVDFLDKPFSSFYHISEATYHYLDSVFSGFYQRISFETSIKDSTFKKSKQYEIISVPFISTNNQLVQFEIFGKLSDPNNDNRQTMTAGRTLYEYIENSEALDIYNSELSLGAGISFQTSPYSKIKVLISNKNLPGYGTSQALIGFESRF
ncbi:MULTISPECIES: hypothetical protein [Psychromonas]|uniref:hypothetical protein n=1 Tax=Psychromonas TaxID=67572 RepID=UPI00041FAD0A|nr:MULTISPECIES: hypothetical protein [Psychromonas]MBB1273011.1 hypothetical protein [Psychromonas sp. SR45-3]